jgi:formylglycine-generating enzyme required for sulfatase activity
MDDIEQVFCSEHAVPVHNVSLDTYMIGETQVTQELWEAVMGSNPSHYEGPKNPVENVSWDDCKEFIRKLNTITGVTFSLPTEAEWEFAARGGIKSQRFMYSGSNKLDDVAWNWHNSGDQYLEGTDKELEAEKIVLNHSTTHPVGMKQANELGIFDMSGNVSEWCEDYYGAYFSSFQTNPKGPGSGTDRVTRGGSHIVQTFSCRSSFRFFNNQGKRDHLTGLRLAIRKDNSIREFNVNGVSFRMVCVEGGYFWMGATEEQGDDADNLEKPSHGVKVNSYMIGETQVTQELWEAVMGSNPSGFVNPKNPVEYVSWDECKDFIRILNSLTGQNFRLPSEAEWEYAARGGSKSQHYKYSGSNTLYDVAWCWRNSGFNSDFTVFMKGNDEDSENEEIIKTLECKTHPVGLKLPNELGIYDLSGNVFEWCEDRWYYYNSDCPSPKLLHIIRGGCYNGRTNFCRVSYRIAQEPGQRTNHIGFRLAL